MTSEERTAIATGEDTVIRQNTVKRTAQRIYEQKHMQMDSAKR